MEFEAAILQFFQSIRNPFTDVLFSLFSLLGEAMVVGGVAIAVFWLAPRKAGEQIIMTALTSFPVNSLMKFFVARPRPYIAGVVEYGNPFLAEALDPLASFPSGHTQSSSSFLFAAADSYGADRPSARKRAAWITAGVLTLLVMIARMYFGAHYPSDVLVGLLLGAAVALFWAFVFRYLHDYRYLLLLCFAAAAAVPCFFVPTHDYLQAAGLLTGAAVSLAAGQFVLRERKTPFSVRLRRIPVGAAIVAVAFVFAVFFPEGAAWTVLKWFLIALSAGLVAPLFFDALEI